MFAEPETLVSRLLFVGLLVEAVELFRLRRSFDARGLFARETIAALVGGTRWQVRIGATLGGSGAVTAAVALQTAAALVVLVVGWGTPWGGAAALVCLFTTGYLRSRRQIGGSGAEQLTFIVLVTFLFVLLAGGGLQARRLGDGFVTAQVMLAYLASGVSKAASPVWRKGGAMSGVLSTEGYGVPVLGRFLRAHPALDRLLGWGVIVWETAFPLVVVAPRPVMIGLLATGVVFHVSCAVLMGLNRFVWAFCGCYPAVWSTALLLK